MGTSEERIGPQPSITLVNIQLRLAAQRDFFETTPAERFETAAHRLDDALIAMNEIIEMRKQKGRAIQAKGLRKEVARRGESLMNGRLNKLLGELPPYYAEFDEVKGAEFVDLGVEVIIRAVQMCNELGTDFQDKVMQNILRRELKYQDFSELVEIYGEVEARKIIRARWDSNEDIEVDPTDPTITPTFEWCIRNGVEWERRNLGSSRSWSHGMIQLDTEVDELREHVLSLVFSEAAGEVVRVIIDDEYAPLRNEFTAEAADVAISFFPLIDSVLGDRAVEHIDRKIRRNVGNY